MTVNIEMPLYWRHHGDNSHGMTATMQVYSGIMGIKSSTSCYYGISMTSAVVCIPYALDSSEKRRLKLCLSFETLNIFIKVLSYAMTVYNV